MGLFEDALIFATKKHNGKVRKATGIPAILHSIEVAHIISTITTNTEVMVAGLLHDVVEDTDGTLDEIRELFGDRVAELVDLETENKYEGIDKATSWKRRKDETIKRLKAHNDKDAEILWLGDKLSNIRSLANAYSEQGVKAFDMFHQKDPNMHLWYYKTIGEVLEMDLNTTGAFKEYIYHINYIWPGTFANEKVKYKKYREISLDGCQYIGSGAKADVYRYNDEQVLKLYNEDNEYKDIERESALTRLAFVAGIPTVIPFGIVKVGKRYGAIFELLKSKTVSMMIADNPSELGKYATIMASIARKVHDTHISEKTSLLPESINKVYEWIDNGIAYEDETLATSIRKMVEALPETKTLIHGDFHTGNVIAQGSEYILIDMDGLSICHPIVELARIYMFYIGFWEVETPLVEHFMPYSIETGIEFYNKFIRAYLERDDIQDVVNKSALLCYVRLVQRCYSKGSELSSEELKAKDYYMGRIRKLIKEVETLTF
ncbi:MAG: HD domain-containing protein [Lachnospiraceae bacterium]|nr:HD domain-containing protein [Lachnospiraceae bacterium]